MTFSLEHIALSQLIGEQKDETSGKTNEKITRLELTKLKLNKV